MLFSEDDFSSYFTSSSSSSFYSSSTLSYSFTGVSVFFCVNKDIVLIDLSYDVSTRLILVWSSIISEFESLTASSSFSISSVNFV